LSALLSELINSTRMKISDWMAARADAQRRTLEERKQELSGLLKKNDHPILVVIDNIDRLIAMEIQLIFRVVKANLDLSKVSYLLLFQRDIVEGALTEVSSSPSGRNFLDKIVQAGFDMPAVEPQRLQQVLFTELNKIFRQPGEGSGQD
jgi:predicted KAP-like P-loop ATPase